MLDKYEHDRLKEIQNEMEDLLEEAKNLVRRSGDKLECERAKTYWIAYIESAIDGAKSPMLRCTMGDTIIALKPSEDGDEENER